MPEVWPTAAPVLARALRGTRIRISDLDDAVLSGRVMLWRVEDRGATVGWALIQEVFDLEDRAVLKVIAVAGRGGKRWVPLLHSFLAEQVRAGHCSALVASCRPGMTRWLRRLGWKVRRIEMEYGGA